MKRREAAIHSIMSRLPMRGYWFGRIYKSLKNGIPLDPQHNRFVWKKDNCLKHLSFYDFLSPSPLAVKVKLKRVWRKVFLVLSWSFLFLLSSLCPILLLFPNHTSAFVYSDSSRYLLWWQLKEKCVLFF